MFQERIKKIVEEGYDISLSEVINEAFNLVFKKILLMSILFMVMYFIVNLVAQYLAYTIAGVDLQEFFSTYVELVSSGNPERLASYILSIEDEMNVASAISVVFSLLIFPMSIGYVEMVKNADLGSSYSFSDIFKPYTSSKAVGLMMIYVAIIILTVVGFMLCVLPGFYILTALSLAPMIYWFNKEVSFGEALTGSLKVVNKNFFTILLAFAVLSILGALGMILCYVGLLVTMPITYAGYYFVYKKIFMKEDYNSEIEQIGEV